MLLLLFIFLLLSFTTSTSFSLPFATTTTPSPNFSSICYHFFFSYYYLYYFSCTFYFSPFSQAYYFFLLLSLFSFPFFMLRKLWVTKFIQFFVDTMQVYNEICHPKICIFLYFYYVDTNHFKIGFSVFSPYLMSHYINNFLYISFVIKKKFRFYKHKYCEKRVESCFFLFVF